MDGGTVTNGGGSTEYKSLLKDGRFWVVKTVMNSIEKMGTAKICICLSERKLKLYVAGNGLMSIGTLEEGGGAAPEGKE